MALNTLDFLVHPTQRIASLIVVKFRDGTDRLPTGGSVAILARDVDRAVGVPQILLLLRRTRRTLSNGLKS
jgi:hypothetical protein